LPVRLAADIAPYLKAAADTHTQPALLADADAGVDCAGRDPAGDYRTWTGELAKALGNHPAVVVVRAGTADAKCPAAHTDDTHAMLLNNVTQEHQSQDSCALSAPNASSASPLT
jgi:hypothetical protein